MGNGAPLAPNPTPFVLHLAAFTMVQLQAWRYKIETNA